MNTQYPTTTPHMLADIQNEHGFDSNDILQAAEFLAGKRLTPWSTCTQTLRNATVEMLWSNDAPRQ